MRTSKPGLTVEGNLAEGRATLIRAPGYQHPIKATINVVRDDGTLIDLQEDPNRPRLVDKLAPSVLAGLILEAIKNAAAFPRRCLGL